MLLSIAKWAAAAALAMAPFPVLAADAECSASVCQDGTWPEMEVAAPPFALDEHVSTEMIEEMVASHVATDEATPAGHEETVHAHQYAVIGEVVAKAMEP